MNEKKGIDWSAGQTKDSGVALPISHFWSSRKWNQLTIMALTMSALAVIISVFILYRGYFGNVETRTERSLVVALLLIYAFLKYPLGRKSWQEKLNWLFGFDLLLILLTIATEIYTLWDVEVFTTENIFVNLFATDIRVDHITGVIILLLLFEATRRAFGWVLVGIPAAFLIYSLTAGYWPAPLHGGQISWTYLTEILYVQNEGVYGIGTQVFIDMVFLYILFGGFISASKIGAFFMGAASSLTGQFSGGPAKVAIIGSASFGSISGSAIANVATTGAITIPMMKSTGYKPAFAGAVESCASTAGYFTPPLMGAAAFLISAFVGIPYIKVCLYVAIPAALYYIALFSQVHFRAKRDGLQGLPKEELPSFRKVMAQGGHLIIPLIVIVAALVAGFSVTRVAVWGIMTAIIVSLFHPETRLNPRSIIKVFDNTISTTVGVCIVMIMCGVIQGSLMVTGLGIRLSLLVEAVAMGSMFLGLVLAALVCLILGTGLPTVLVYYISTAFIIPALEGMGAVTMSVHLFALMFGAMAMITPPVCVAAFTAASIAGAAPMKTGLTATRLGFAGYIVPFLMVFNPALILFGASFGGELISIFTAIASVVLIAAGFEGYLIARANILERIILITSGLCFIAFQYFLAQDMSIYQFGTVIAGGSLAIIALLMQKYVRRTIA